MEQTKALDALEPFLALSKSATSPRAAADLVTRATSSPTTFLFTELLSTPQIQSLATAGAEFAPYLTLLQIFSFGTYASYTATPNLPPLSDAQALKLRQLSILSLSSDLANLSYTALASALGLSLDQGPRELEDVVISTIYAGLVAATLDPVHGRVQVSSVAPLRDLAPHSIPPLLDTLKAWSARCESTLVELESRVADIRAQARTRATETALRDAQLARALEEEKVGPEGGLGGLHAGGKKEMRLGQGRPPRFLGKRGSNLMAPDVADDEAMDLDDDDDEADGKKRASRRKL